MQLPTVLSTSTSNTGRGLLSPAHGRSWLVWSAQTALPCQQMLLCQVMPLYQQMPLHHQDLMPDDAVVNHGGAGRAAISGFDVRPASTSETVITSIKDKKDETSNADRQSRSATNKRSNGRQKNLVCESCNYRFTHTSALIRHNKTIHEQNRILPQCDVCHVKFSRKDGLEKHKRFFHSNCQGGFTCDFCSRSLPTRFELKQHCDMHTGTKKIPCQFCGNTFAGLSELVQHQMCHSGVKDKEFRCGECTRVFHYKHQLLKHRGCHDAKLMQKCDE